MEHITYVMCEMHITYNTWLNNVAICYVYNIIKVMQWIEERTHFRMDLAFTSWFNCSFGKMIVSHSVFKTLEVHIFCIFCCAVTLVDFKLYYWCQLICLMDVTENGVLRLLRAVANSGSSGFRHTCFKSQPCRYQLRDFSASSFKVSVRHREMWCVCLCVCVCVCVCVYTQ